MAKAATGIKKWDYRTNKKAKGVELIVRKFNQYGEAEAGEIVIVDGSEAKNPSTRSCCMTAAESKELDKAIAEAAAKAKDKKENRPIQKMVEAGMKRIADAAIAMRAAKEKAKADELEAAEAE